MNANQYHDDAPSREITPLGLLDELCSMLAVSRNGEFAADARRDQREFIDFRRSSRAIRLAIFRMRLDFGDEAKAVVDAWDFLDEDEMTVPFLAERGLA